MRPNRLRQLLDKDQPTLGTHLLSSWPTLTELVGLSGTFDYVEFVAEYAPYDLYALDNLGRAVELYDMSAMMKVEQEPRTYLAVRAIGSGIQNVLFADPRTVEDVEECVRAVRAESPETGGRHGVGCRRDVRTVMEVGSPSFVQALEDSVVAIMIEKVSAVENLEAILSVEGVDMVQFGPGDYSMSIGIPGQWSHPKVMEAQEYVNQTALKMGVAPRIEMGTLDDDRVKRYLDQGIKHFCIGSDTQTMYDWFVDTGGRFCDLIGRKPATPTEAQTTRYGE